MFLTELDVMSPLLHRTAVFIMNEVSFLEWNIFKLFLIDIHSTPKTVTHSLGKAVPSERQ